MIIKLIFQFKNLSLFQKAWNSFKHAKETLLEVMEEMLLRFSRVLQIICRVLCY